MQKSLHTSGEYYALLLHLDDRRDLSWRRAQELLTAYIGLEILSFSLYILVSYQHNNQSVEAGMKYMLLGAFASALLLYGISFIYGTSGSTSYAEISAGFANGTSGFTFGTLLGPDADHGGHGLQGVGRALPHVDAGRLPGRTVADYGLPLGDVEGGRLRAVPALFTRP